MFGWLVSGTFSRQSRPGPSKFRLKLSQEWTLQSHKRTQWTISPSEYLAMNAFCFGPESAAFERVHTLFADVKYSVRTLQRSPGFASCAILALALGIGANVAVFSVVDAVLLRPLQF